MDKKHISKIYHNGDTLYVKDAEARETMVSGVSYDTTNKKIVETINGVNSDVVSVSTIKSDLNLSKSDVGLGNVGNFKAVSTASSQGLTDTEKSNARANIGAGTSSFSGSYDDLSDKPTIPAEVTETTVSGWGFTKNTGTVTGISMNGASKGTSGVVDLGTVITEHQDISGKVNTSTKVNGHALTEDVTVSKSDVGLGNVTNDAQVKRSEMGAASGVATLDSAGKVPSSQLPSYVDDVLEYDTKSAFPATGEAGKIYVDKSNNTTWRWSGTAYTQIKGDLVIGTTTGTAADGGTASAHYSNTSNPHSVTKEQVGLGSVVNTGDSATPVSGGTTKFTTGGAYTELAKKVDKVTGKGLSTNDYTTDEKNKLGGIEAGAQKHIAPTAAEVKSALGTGSGTTKYLREDGTWQTPAGSATDIAYDTTNKKITKTVNGVTSDVVTAAKIVADGTPYDAEVEYLESTGTQYINTGMKLFESSPTNLEISMKVFVNTGQSFYSTIINGLEEIDPYPGIVIRTNNNNIQLARDGAENPITIGSCGSVQDITRTENNLGVHDVPVTLFASLDENNAPWRYCKLKLYSLSIKRNSEFVFDAIPVRVGQVGYLYDKVSGQLFGNSGTGSFVLGPDKEYLPLSGGTMDSNAVITFPEQTTGYGNKKLSFGKLFMDGYGNYMFDTTATDNNYWSVGKKVGSADTYMFTVHHNGNVGIGTTSPETKLHVNGKTRITATSGAATSGNGALYIQDSCNIDFMRSLQILAPSLGTSKHVTMAIGTGDSRFNQAQISFYNNGAGNSNNLLTLGFHSADDIFALCCNGKAGIGLSIGTVPSYKLHVNGDVAATSFVNTSDIRKKNIIDNVKLSVEDIAKAPLFKFSWLDPEMPEGVNVGTSAQYWQTLIPEIVSEANDDEKTLSMQYGVAGLASSIALAKKVVEQEETIKAQEVRIKALEDAIVEIQSKLNK